MNKEEAYELGKDSVINGANTTNCNFSIFAFKELKDAWENGRNHEQNKFVKHNKTEQVKRK